LINITTEIPELLSFSRALEGLSYQVAVMERILNTFSMVMARNAKKKVKQRTKKTAQSIAVSTPSPLTRAITVHDIAGMMLEFGTAPHIIMARRASALMLPITPGMSHTKAMAGASPFSRTFGPTGTGRLSGVTRGGQVAFFKSVHHSGSRAYPFMMPAFQEAMGELAGMLALASQQILGRMAGKGELGALAQVIGV
jgi:hypothetical protein